MQNLGVRLSMEVCGPFHAGISTKLVDMPIALEPPPFEGWHQVFNTDKSGIITRTKPS